LEHLVFKGTPKHSDIPKEFNQYGARWNGTTWLERTNYFETFPASDEALRWALDLEADRMVNSNIAKKDLDSEMTVVRNEFEMGENSPNRVLMDRVLSTAYLWHNYGKSTIGSRSDVENVPIERLQAFYKQHYQPDNSVLVVAGKIDEAKTLEIIKEKFGAIPKPARKILPTYTAEPTQDGERFVTLRRVGDVQLLMAGYHVPPGSHADYPAVEILTGVLGDVPAGRLHKALVETQKAASAGGFSLQVREPGMALFTATVRKEQSLEEARNILTRTLDDVAIKPPAKEEVERARTALLKQIELNINNSERIGLQLSEWASMGDWRLMFLHRDRLKSVTTEDVARAASTYLKESNRTLGQFIPTANPVRAEIPKMPDVEALVKNYKGQAEVAKGEDFDPSPANIDSRSKRTDVTGIKFTLLPKKTRGNTVNAIITLRMGDEKSLMNRSAVSVLTSSMLMRGTSKRTRQQITDEFDRLKARTFVGGGGGAVTASIETVRSTLPEVLTLLSEVLRDPAFPAAEFDQLKQQRLAGIESQKSEPQQIAFTALSRHLNSYPKGDIRYVPTPDENIEETKAVTLEDVKAFYRDYYGASAAEITVVGDFDDSEIRTHLTSLFGGWKSGKPFKDVPRPYQKAAVVNQSFEAPDKAGATLTAGMPIAIKDTHPDYAALVLGNYILGGSFDSRFVTRIRQKEGLSYGFGSNFSARVNDDGGSWMAYGIMAPQNTLKVEQAFKDEIQKALKDGFTDEEVKRAKSGWLQNQRVSRAQDAELVRRLTGLRFYNRTMQFEAELEKKVESLTAADLNEALRRHLDASQISIFKAGDFKKAGVTP
jgi:zinc protease